MEPVFAEKEEKETRLMQLLLFIDSCYNFSDSHTSLIPIHRGYDH